MDEFHSVVKYSFYFVQIHLFLEAMSLHDDGYSEYYQRTMYLPSPEHYGWFLSRVSEGGKVLDFGAGTGRFAAAFKRDRPDITVDTVEAHPDAVKLLKARKEISHVYETRFEHFSPRMQYDGIWAKECLFFPEKDQLPGILDRIHGALAKNGKFYSTFIRQDELPNPSVIFRRYTESDLRALFASHSLAIDSLKEFEGAFCTARLPANCISIYALRV